MIHFLAPHHTSRAHKGGAWFLERSRARGKLYQKDDEEKKKEEEEEESLVYGASRFVWFGVVNPFFLPFFSCDKRVRTFSF